MNHSVLRHGTAQQAAEEIDQDTDSDTTALALALTNALNRIHQLEQAHQTLRDLIRQLSNANAKYLANVTRLENRLEHHLKNRP